MVFLKTKQKKQLLSLVEAAVLMALAVVLDYLCKLIPFQFPYGGGISVSVLPLIYFTFRRGTKWGLGAGVVFSALQIITGWYPPPAGTWWALILCILLDYLLAFALLGLANLFAKPFGSHRLVGYGVGAVAVCLLRFLCSFLSGVILWETYCPEGMNVWVYSLLYNGGYMLPNAILTGVLAVLLCRTMDPLTLRPMKKDRKEA